MGAGPVRCSVVLALLWSGPAWGAEAPRAVERSVRMAIGGGYVVEEYRRPDGMDTGVAFAVDIAQHLGQRWRLGVSYAFERYWWSNTGTEHLDGSVPLFINRTLLDQRLLGFVRFDPLPPGPVSPFISVGVGKARSAASLYRVQCTPHERSGWTAEVGAGVDVAVADSMRVGLDWRAAAAPNAVVGCTLAFRYGEPPDPPDGTRHRLLVGVTFENPF
jgi:opacity protein-like surface antigen